MDLLWEKLSNEMRGMVASFMDHETLKAFSGTSKDSRALAMRPLFQSVSIHGLPANIMRIPDELMRTSVIVHVRHAI
jgi:hypothetical protein